MNESLRIGKRAFTVAVAAATILWSVGFAALVAPSSASAASAGDLIKGSLSTVYYYAADGNRYAFTSEKNYFSWYENFSGVVTISDSELAAIPLGGNIVNRPGSYWIKITSDPKTYAVTPQGQIRWIESEEVATGLAGADWNQFIIDVADVYFTDYTVGASLTSAANAYNGALVEGSVYLIQDGEKRMVTDSGMSGNRFQSRFVLDGEGINLDGIPSGSDVSGKEGDLADTAQLGDAVTGGLKVSLASDTPASATIPAGASSVPFTKWKFEAQTGTASLNQLIVSLGGIGAVANIENVYLYEGSVRMTDGRSVNSNTRQATFSALGMNWGAGEMSYLTARVDVSTTPTGGDTANLGIKAAGDVIGSATVSGTFPATGNTMTFSETEAGTVTIDKTGSISDPTLGQEGAVIGRFTVEADDEDAMVEQVTLNVDDAQDHSNYLLWMGDEKVSTCLAPVGDLVTCPFTNMLNVEDGDSESLKLSADIGGEGGDSIKVGVEERADVLATGGDFGFNLQVDIEGYDDTGSACTGSGDDCSYSEIQGGELTFAFNGPTSGDVMIDGDDEVFFEFALTSENFVEVNNIGVGIECVDDSGCLFDGGGDAALEDITIRNANGSAFMGPEELDLGGNSDDQWIDFDDAQTLNAGTSLDLMITANTTSDDGMDGERYRMHIDMDGSDSDGIMAEDINGDDLAADDIVPGSDLTGNIFTLSASSLEVAATAPPSDGTYVKGAANVPVVGFSWEAGDTSDVTVTDVTFTVVGSDTVDGNVANNGLTERDYVNSCTLYDQESGLVIDGPESVTTGSQVLFESFDWDIAAGETAKTITKCNFAKLLSNDNDDEFAFGIDSSDDITAEDNEGSEVEADLGEDNTDGDVAIITVTDTGSLDITLDGATPKSTIVLGNSTGVGMATFKVRATNEAFTVTDLTLENCVDYEGSSTCDTYGEDTAVSSLMLSYTNEAGESKTKTSFFTGGVAMLGGLELWAPQDVSQTFSVSVNTSAVSSTSAASGSEIGVGINVDGFDFEAVGKASGDTLTEDDWESGLEACEDTNDGVCAGNPMVLRKTKPTVSLASGSPSGAGVAGFSEAFRFNVSADSRGFVELNSVLFQVSTSGTGTWNDCDGELDDTDKWSFYDLSNPSEELDDDGDWTFEEADASCDGGDLAVANLDLSADTTTPIEEIGAGTTKTYVLEVDTTGADGSSDDSIRIDIPTETTADGLGSGWDAINWNDDAEETSIDGTYIKNLPVRGGTIVF